MDEHTETAYSTFNMSSLHWTDTLEIILIGAAGLFFLRYLRRYPEKRRQREEAQRQAQLLSTIQGSIQLSPLPVNPSFASAPVRMIEDKSTQNSRGSRPSSFRIDEPWEPGDTLNGDIEYGQENAHGFKPQLILDCQMIDSQKRNMQMNLHSAPTTILC